MRLLAAEGARVIAHGFTRAPELEGLDAEAVLSVRGDLREEAEVERIFEEIVARFGGCDALVANAGLWVAEPAPLHEMTLAQWENTMRSDLTSVFLCCRALLRDLVRDPREDASIVLIGSTAAIFGEAEHADYASAKAAMSYGLLPSLKNEIVKLAPRGRVNAVCPGWTLTNMAKEALLTDEAKARIFSTMPLAKVAQPEDIASATVFLLSERMSGHISGVVLPVAGGMEGRLLRAPESTDA